MKEIFIALFSTTVVFFIYYPLIKIIASHYQDEIKKVVLQRLLGTILFGCLPFFLIILNEKQISDYGWESICNLSYSSILWIIGLSIIILIINSIFSKKKDNLKVYPQIRKTKWTIYLILLNFITWALYLLGYEFLFRGYLLFTCVPILGQDWSICINTIIYSLAHLPKGKKETLATIPFGLLLCYITLSEGNIWIAFCSHLVLALSNDYFAIRTNSDMQFVVTNTTK